MTTGFAHLESFEGGISDGLSAASTEEETGRGAKFLSFCLLCLEGLLEFFAGPSSARKRLNRTTNGIVTNLINPEPRTLKL